MNDYMRENKIDNVKPEIAPNAPPVKEKMPVPLSLHLLRICVCQIKNKPVPYVITNSFDA
jgi:hypothetical protein